MKRFLSVILVLILVFSVAFQCSLQSSAVVGIDDALLIGAVCVDLLSLGVTIYGVQEFCQTDAFHDFCNFIFSDDNLILSNKLKIIDIHGKLFYFAAKTAWLKLCDWVSNTFSGKQETKDVEFETTETTTPEFITLKDGTTVPYAEFMAKPFLITKLNGTVRAWSCTGMNPGVNILQNTLRLWCTGTGKCIRYTLSNGDWGDGTSFDMHYGLTYKDTTGSYFDVQFNASSLNGQPVSTYIQYRTMDYVADSGSSQEESTPNQTPTVEQTDTYTVTMSSDPTYYPGNVLAPATDIADTDAILIPVPDELVVDDGNGNLTLSNDIPLTARTIAGINPTDVRPVVQTNTITNSTTISQIIADTPAESIPGSSSSDIETANKFRLPKSFLEGFPFSIPYSIFVGIKSFVAEAQAPVFNFPFSIPALNINEDIEIDLSPWAPVARLCRAILSLVWVAGLAFACYSFIKR